MTTESKPVGQDIDSKIRTIDVEIDRNVSFEQLMLSPAIIAGLKSNNFIYPSPIQLKAIPLARCGKDLFIQAKSGTGKTLVFAVTILERATDNDKGTGVQSLVVVPTREIAIQVTAVIAAVGKKLQKFNAVSCIGGTEIEHDRKRVSSARCVVGTPGRVLHLIRNRIINPESVKLVVLDEADKLLNDCFDSDIKDIMDKMSSRDQTLIVSATLDLKAQQGLLRYMKDPLGVTPKKEAPILVGITQIVYQLPKFANVIEEMQQRLESLVRILKAVEYNQCLVFTNSQSRAESFANGLHERGFLSEFISGALDQNARTKVFERILQSPTCRIIVTTDLLARGIDAERVNLVVNMELPPDQFCYLHRIGRAGRFGSLGTAITFVSEGEERFKFRNVLYDEEYPIYKVKQGEEEKLSEAIEKKTVAETFDKLMSSAVTEDNLNGNEAEKEKPTPELDSTQKTAKIFDLYEDFILKGAGVEPSTLKESLSNVTTPVINTTNNIFLQKIIEMNLYGEDEDAKPVDIGQGSAKSDKTNGDDSTKSVVDSSTSLDDLQESDINADEENLNTQSAQNRVDAFLDTLDNVSNPGPRSTSSQISATTYTVTRAFETKENSQSNSGSASDDEASKSDTDSKASNRGSTSYQNEIDDDSGSDSDDEEDEEEEEFFEASEQLGQHYVPKSVRNESRQKSASAMSYQSNRNAHSRWSHMYWLQTSQIADYVNHCRFIAQKQTY